MTLCEIEELKDQLEELWTEGFISSDILPRDVPVLFVKKEDNDTRLCMDYVQIQDDMRDGQNSDVMTNEHVYDDEHVLALGYHTRG